MAQRLILSARLSSPERDVDRKGLARLIERTLRAYPGMTVEGSVVIEDDFLGKSREGVRVQLLLSVSISVMSTRFDRRTLAARIETLLREQQSSSVEGDVAIEEDVLAGTLGGDEDVTPERPMNFNRTMPPD